MSWLTHVTSRRRELHKMDYHISLRLLRGGTAGTFALAALVAMFPGINFILLDSDCLPVTLFEAADPWKEAYLTRFPSGTGKGLLKQHPLHRRREFANHPEVVYTQQRVSAKGDGASFPCTVDRFPAKNSDCERPDTGRDAVLDPVWAGTFSLTGHLYAIFSLFLPCMGADRCCPQRTLATTWTCWCPLAVRE